MGANVWPVDAVTGAPSYTGRLLRQLAGLGWARNPARPLGARSGVVTGTPNTIATATSTTWTVTPFGGVIDGETSAVAGGYNFTFDTNQTGSVNAADATNPRIDLLYVKVSDPAEGDGSTNPIIQLLYLAGTAAASPAVPATPARSMPLATILVPKSGTGSPVVSFVAAWAVAAGAPVPVYSQTERDALTAYTGLQASRLDLNGRVDTYNGAAWDQGSSPVAVQRLGTGGAVGVGTSNVPITAWGAALFNIGDIAYSAGVFTVTRAGVYRFDMTFQWPAAAASYRVFQFALINGAIDGAGEQSIQFVSGTGALTASGSGIVQLAAAGTVQACLLATTGGVTGVVPVTFSLQRVA